MASMGLAILSGLLGGLGQIGRVHAEARQRQLEEERARRDERRLEELIRHQKEQERLSALERLVNPEPFQGVFQEAGLPAPTGPQPVATFNALLQRALALTRERQQGRASEEFGRVMAEAGGRPASLPEVSRAEHELGSPAIPPMTPMQMLARIGPLAPFLSERLFTLAEKAVEEPKPMAVGERGVYIPGKGFMMPPEREPSPPPSYDPTKQRLTTTFDKAGQRSYSLADISPSTALITPEDLRRRLALENQDPSNPLRGKLVPGTLIYEQRYGDLAKQYQIAPGGALVGSGTGTVLAERPGTPAAGERERLADLNSALGGVQALLKQIEGNKSILGGWLANPAGAARRSLGNIYAGAMTPEERQFLANLATQVVEFKREFIGKQQTIPELKGLLDALPDKGDIDASVLPKLQATLTQLHRRKAELEAVLRGSSLRVPGAAIDPDPFGWKR